MEAKLNQIGEGDRLEGTAGFQSGQKYRVVKVPSAQNRWVRLGFIFAKLIIVPLVLVLVVQQGLKSAPDFPADFGIRHLLAAALAYQLAVLANSGRLCVLLKSFGAPSDLVAVQRMNLLSHLYYFIFMTGVAMEAFRFLRLRRINVNLTRPDTITIIVLDRMIGAIASTSMLVLGTLTLISRHGDASRSTLMIVGGLMAMLSAAGAGLFIPSVRSHVRRVQELLLRSPSILPRAFLQSVAGNLLMVIGVWGVVYHLQMNVDFGQILWAVMAGQVLTLVPVSLLGIGVAEIGAVALLAAVGVSPTEAVVVVFLVYFMKVSAALVGLGIGLWEDGSGFFERRVE